MSSKYSRNKIRRIQDTKKQGSLLLFLARREDEDVGGKYTVGKRNMETK